LNLLRDLGPRVAIHPHSKDELTMTVSAYVVFCHYNPLLAARLQ